MSYIPTLTLNQSQVSMDTVGRLRTSGLTTLGDYKEIAYTRNLLFDLEGTGTTSSSGVNINKFYMHVEPGQWLVRQTHIHHAYFSGKSQVVELTFDTFAPQAGVTKRIGYFSGDMDPPYLDHLDGVWLESRDSTVYFKLCNAGVTVYEKEFTQWKGYSQLQGYDWNLFNVAIIDFLWLGGATARLFLKTGEGFVLADEYVHAQSVSGVFFESPNQPLRFDLFSNGAPSLSTGGTGDFRTICAAVATEGSYNQGGLNRSIVSDITGTSYTHINEKMAVLAVRKKPTAHQVAALINDLFIFTQTQDDRVYWTLEINPSLSGHGMVYNGTEITWWQDLPNSCLQYAVFDDTVHFLQSGTIIADGILVYPANVPAGVIKDSNLSWFGADLNHNQDIFVLTMTPLVGTSNVVGGISVKEF